MCAAATDLEIPDEAIVRRYIAKHEQERTPVSPELAEALRNEIRTALEAGGGPFDINVARQVYDLAIAARDMCVAATGSVKEAIDQIKDTNGPMESLDTSDTPESQMQVSESFGARLLRELMASLPMLQQPREGDDPKELVHALAEARRNGMHDVAEQIEVKLFGRVLSGPRPVTAEEVDVVEGSYEHGFADGRAGTLPVITTEGSNYHRGYLRGMEARLFTPTLPIAPLNGLTGNRLIDDPPLCEACVKDPDPRGGSACYDCREIASRRSKDHGHVSRYDDTDLRGRPSNRAPMDPIERAELEGK
jgi:hypothetical protein